MSLFQVDEYLCTRCGICSDVCPVGIIPQPDDDTTPAVPEPYEKMCIKCGHCEVFCPSRALIFNFRPEEHTSLPDDEKSIPPHILSHYLKKRRSIRNFKHTNIPESDIHALIETASFAASGGNKQPVKWLVIYNMSKVRRIAELTIEWMQSLVKDSHPMSGYFARVISAWGKGRDTITLGAPHLIFNHIPDGNPSAFTDAIIAMTHIDITAPSMGIGSCWAGFIMMACSGSEALRKELELPKDRKAACAMMLGIPKYTPHSIPRRNTPDITWCL